MENGSANGESSLEIRVLGEVVVKLNGNLLSGFDSPRVQRLFAQLCAEGGVSRTRLAFDLWPDSTESQARGNLRKLLHDVRQMLPDAERFVDLGPQVLRWRSGADLYVDLAEFRAGVNRGDLETAASAYRGDLLPACYDDWVLTERDNLRTQASEVMLELASRSLGREDFDGAAGYARRAVAIDNLSEPAYRLLIDAHAGRGDRGEGLRTFHRCVEVLRREIGVEPQPATRVAYEALLTSSQSAPTAPEPSPVAPLIGRATELASALAVWQNAAQGTAHLLLIDGEPGIGKTRLAEELARLVGGQGFPVARSRAYQAAGAPSWGPVVDWIRSEGVRSALDRLEPAWLAEVARLVPELRATTPVSLRGEPVSEVARHRLFDALTRALFAGSRPILLVIDDLQWCDLETVEMIRFALRAAPAAPAMVLGTVRSGEIDEDHPLASLRRELMREGRLTEIMLDRLDADATEELAASVGGARLDRAAAERLWIETEGMPLFVVEAVRTGPVPAGAPVAVSPTVRAVISARLTQLSPMARRLVEVAATVGRSFTVEILAAAGSLDDDSLVDALDELWRRQIVREQSGGYDFSHDRIREVAYSSVPPARRRRLHGRVGRALAAAQGNDQALASVVAAHYEQAGLVEEAVAALLAAGRRSLEVFALEDAIAAFRHGLFLLEQLPGGRQRDETELAFRTALAVPLVATEGYGSHSVQEVYQRGMALCERLGRQADPEVLRGLGLASLMSCRFDRAAKLADTLLKQAPTDSTAATEGHYLMGVSAFWRGDLAASADRLGLAIESFRPENAGDHLLRYAQDPKAVCTVRLAVTSLWMGRLGASRRLTEEALDYSMDLGHPTTEGYVRMYTAMLAAEREDPEELDRQLAAGETVWSEQKLGYFQAVGRLLRRWHSVLAGAPHAVAELAEEVAGWRSQAQTLHFSYGLLLLCRAQLQAGEVHAGLKTAAEGINWSVQHDQRYLEAEFRRIEVELMAKAGRGPLAADRLYEAVQLARSQRCGWFALRAANSLADLVPGRPSRELLGEVRKDFSSDHAEVTLR